MAEYWGLKEICSRMGWRHTSTPVRQMRDQGFLMMMRRRGSNPRRYWWTDDNLILVWLVSCCKVDRERVLAREAAKQGQGGGWEEKAS
jgi:hypothetical protein